MQSERDNMDMITGRIGGGRVGDLLRRRRAELGQDIGVVARALRIRQSYLVAIEDGDLGALPGPTYVVGFVRSYAEHLGFDGPKIIAEFRREVGIANPPSPMRWKGQPASEGGGMGAAPFVLLIVVLLLLGAGWYLLGRQVVPESVIEGLPGFLRPRAEAMAPAPEEATESTAESETSVTEGSVGETEGSGEAGVENGALGADASAAPSGADQATPPASTIVAPAMGVIGDTAASAQTSISGASAEAVVAPENSPSVVAGTSTVTTDTTESQSSEVLPARPRVVIRARLESWIEITNAKQEVLVARVLRAGETIVVPDEQGLIMNTGNAGGLDIEIDGRMAPRLGSIGLVRRGISLDPVQLAGGEVQAAPPAPTAPELPEPDLNE